MDALDEVGPVGWNRLVIEPRRPEAIRQRPNAYWLAVAAVRVGAFMGELDASIVTVALPNLQRTFHAGVGAVTWVGLSYLLVLVATVAAVGRFADMWGRKLLYVYGFGIFIVGSALCGLAPSLGALIGFRALQAVGAALLQANSVAIIVLAVPRGSLGRAIGIQGAAQAVGLALGPTIGGFLLAAGGWRLIFYVNVPFGLLGMTAGLLSLGVVTCRFVHPSTGQVWPSSFRPWWPSSQRSRSAIPGAGPPPPFSGSSGSVCAWVPPSFAGRLVALRRCSISISSVPRGSVPESRAA